MSRPEDGAPAPVIAVLGAESTGKTALSRALVQALEQRYGLQCAWVSEWLRLWCDQQGRTPRAHEQEAIAAEQCRRIAQARHAHRIVVADTTSLMTALYSRLLFQDQTLLASALAVQRDYALTLVTDNDLPWQADGLQRDGPQVREPVRTMLVSCLQEAGIEHHCVGGLGPRRLEAALRIVEQRLKPTLLNRL